MRAIGISTCHEVYHLHSCALHSCALRTGCKETGSSPTYNQDTNVSSTDNSKGIEQDSLVYGCTCIASGKCVISASDFDGSASGTRFPLRPAQDFGHACGTIGT